MQMMNEQFGKLAAPGTLVLERLLPGPIDRVWAYLTESEKRKLWIAAGDMDLRKGGVFNLIFDHEILSEVKEEVPEKYRDESCDHMKMTGHVLAVNPPHLLTISWSEGGEDDSEVTFELEEVGDKVKLTLTHRRVFNRDTLVGISAGWHAHVAILIDNLEGKPARPFWSTHMPLEDEYDLRLPR